MNELSHRLTSILEECLPKEYTSVSYAIALDGKIAARGALGNQGGSEKKPAGLNCVYNVASISKVICAAAVMQLVERGLADLDRPIAEYLPRLRMPDARYQKITLRHCLSHSSGLPGTQWRGFSVTDAEGADYYADVYDYLSKSTLKAAPGEYSVYCNDGFTLAEMVLAEVTGIDYAQYCRENIFEPLGLRSARFVGGQNSDFPLVREGNKPAELLLIRGAAGLAITMSDLCRFGQIFLDDSPVLSRASAAEMGRPQGKTFLSSDERSSLYGLGWDNVEFFSPDYNLGAHALLKGGNSFQFSTSFIVVPEHRAVCALSETHDCGLDVRAAALRVLSEAVLEVSGQGLSVHGKSLPSELKRFEGVYLTQNAALNLHLHGESAELTQEFADGTRNAFCEPLLWNGESFSAGSSRSFSFDEARGEIFLMSDFQGYRIPVAQKARPFQTNAAWEARAGKGYIVCDADASDMVIGEDMSAFKIVPLGGVPGIWRLAFAQRSDSGVYSHFDAPVRAIDDSRGEGFLLTPNNPSRDRLDVRFFTENGVEFCEAASYLYREAAALPSYAGQSFPTEKRRNALYRFTSLSALPPVPVGHRIIVLAEDLRPVFDTLFTAPEEFTPFAKEGFIVLI